MCFHVSFAKFLRKYFLQNTSGRLLLYTSRENVVLHLKLFVFEIFKSSRSQMFIKIGVLKNFVNLTGTTVLGSRRPSVQQLY